ncbi:unnamed protein product [Cuscuta campestris]|uniref:Uncharacterized protein n=1 Tax=Cuscuta campestris TaxID=132261 RepID=A0A484NDU8_9ASTE|nr:unnamed protein product [Cuscuta campestris]
MASLKNISTNEVILTGKRIRNIYEVMWDDVKEACLISKDEEINEEDRMKPTEFIPFGSLPMKTSKRNPDSAEPTANHGQPPNIPDHSHGDHSGNGDQETIHPETPTNSVLQPEAELDQPVNPNQQNLRWLRDHPPQHVIGDIQSGVRTRSAQQNLQAMLACFISLSAVHVAVHSPRLIKYWELSEFLHLEICFKYEEEVLEFYKNGKISMIQSKKNPQRTIQVIKSTVGGTKTIGISGQIPSGPAKKVDLKNHYKLVLELVIACLECGSGGHADDITQERAFIINTLITKIKVNWAKHFFNSVSNHLGKPKQKYLCQGLYLGYILESLGAASDGKKYDARYWLYYLSSKGEIRISSTAEDEGSSDNVLIVSLKKSSKRKRVVSPSPSHEESHTLALVNLDEEVEFPVQGELLKKKRRVSSPSTSGNANPDDLVQNEPIEEVSAREQSPQQFDTPQDQSLPSSPPQAQTDNEKAEDKVRDSLSRDTSNYGNEETEEESVKTLKIHEDEAKQGDDAESLPLQLFLKVPSPNQMETRHNTMMEKSEEKYCSNLNEISKFVDKTLEIISLLSKSVGNTMMAYASDCHLQFKEATAIKQQIATVKVNLQKQMSLLQMDIRSALAVSSANQVVTQDCLKSNPENSIQHLSKTEFDGTEAVGTIASHFTNDAQTEERYNNLKRIQEECGVMEGIGEVVGSSKRKKK